MPHYAMLILTLLLACEPDPSTEWDRGPNPHALDDVLRYNHIQVKGTHNSYHLEPEAVFDDSHRYSHPTLTEQLEQHHVRQFELDIHLAEDGDWHVFHLPNIDGETTCLRFEDCLYEIRDWSDNNGWHLPITIWLEPKDELDGATPGYQLIEDRLLEFEQVVREVFPEDRLFTPDDLRGDAATLPDALAANGWPLLGELRGQVLFSVLNADLERERYLAPSDILEGRVAFVDSSNETDPWSALVKDGSPSDITRWVEAGFVITDNGSGAGDDVGTQAADDQAILDAGVHHAATDHAGPGTGSEYWLDLAPRCNPVSAPAECVDEEVEKL